MGHFEFAGAGAGLVGADALDGLELFVFGEEAGGGNVAVEVPVDDGSGEDGDYANEEKETVLWLVLHSEIDFRTERIHLPFCDARIGDRAKAIRHCSSKHGR